MWLEDPSSPEPKLIERNETTRIVTPNPKEMSIENLYVEKIRNIPKGPKHAGEYHRVASHALGRIFRGFIRNMDIKVPVDYGIKIVDTVFTNCAEDGFFLNVKPKGTYVNVEMKNITGAPTDEELDQLNGRFNGNRGHFGIMVCRGAQNKEAILARCKTFLPNNYVLVLSDEDMVEILEYRRENDIEEINDYMDTKLRTLLYWIISQATRITCLAEGLIWLRSLSFLR